MNRRRFLELSAAGLGAAWLNASCGPDATLQSGVFRHGVASGDPLPDGAVIWTRVTSSDDALPGSGRGPAVEVRWELATSASFTDIIRTGTVAALALEDHTVHVDLRELQPSTDYCYRFTALAQASPTGRFRTAPSENDHPSSIRFGVASCAHYAAGYFAGYRYLVERKDLDLDFVLHVGDYIYEYGRGEYDDSSLPGRLWVPDHELLTLRDYRQRYSQYRQDRDLQSLHARYPFICIWDDHEVADNAWREGAVNHQNSEGSFSDRLRAAYRAYFEWMPVRRPENGSDRLYRSFSFGDLADLRMIDLRQYRDAQPALDSAGRFSHQAASEVPLSLDGKTIDDPTRTILGEAQRQWLMDGLGHSSARWKLIGNPVMISPLKVPSLPADSLAAFRELLGLTGAAEGGVPMNVDGWDGYATDRKCLLEVIRSREIRNVTFFTGDIHSSWASELPLDPGSYPALSPSLAVELVATSVNSRNMDEALGVPPRTTSIAVEEAIQAANRHIKMVEFDSHGISVVEVTPQRLRMGWHYVTNRLEPEAAVKPGPAVIVEEGSSRITRA